MGVTLSLLLADRPAYDSRLRLVLNPHRSVDLVSPLLLPAEVRTELTRLFRLEERDEDYIGDVLRLVTPDDQEWVNELGDQDLMLLVEVFGQWNGVVQAGEALSVAKLLDEHGSAIARDLLADGIDLRDVVADMCRTKRPGRRWQPWWVLALVEEFAHDDRTATFRSMGSTGDERGWGWVEHLLAAIFDSIQVNTVVSARVAGAKKVKNPKPFPRPGSRQDDKPAARTMTQILTQRRQVEEHQQRQQSRAQRRLAERLRERQEG